ncbi:MAG: WYL domain-containing protein [Sphingomonas sp.]
MTYAKARDLVQVALMAASSRGVSLREIEEELDRCRRTAQRITQALELAFPETDRIVDDEGFARWRLPRSGITQLLAPSAEELAALAFAMDELEHAGGGSEARALRSLQGKVRALIPADRSRRLDTDEEALLVAMGHAARPGPRLAVNAAVDAAIAAALKGPCHLRIVYRSWGADAAHDRIVAPHGLLLGVRRYLVAIDTAKAPEGMRHYRVEDIEEAEVLGTSFEIAASFSLEAHAHRSFGSYHRPSEYCEIVWRFRPEAVERARRFVFHPSQRFETAADGSLVVRFEASGFLEMCWHLYAWGDAVEVLAPPELATMVSGYRRSDFASLP